MSETSPLLHQNSTHIPRISTVTPPFQLKIPSLANQPNLCKIRTASAAILFCVVLERIAYYGMSGNLVLFLNKDPFYWESYHATNASFYFLGVSFVTSLIGGWLADSIFGRFKAILFSFMIYLVGYVLMTLLSPRNYTHTSALEICAFNSTSYHNESRNPFNEPCAMQVFIALTITATGSGFIRANIAPFGSDQVAREGHHLTLSFFNWFYWSVNLGGLIGLGAITYLQQQHSFFTGYITALAALSLSVILFLSGRCFYSCRPPDGSVLSNIFRIICEACRRRRQRVHARRLHRGFGEGPVDEAEPSKSGISFLDNAKHRYGGVFHDALVDDVKELKKIICVFAALIPYWLVYFQMQTTFLLQGLHMDLMINNLTTVKGSCVITNITGNSLHHHNSSCSLTEIEPMLRPGMVAAWLTLFDVVILIFLLPLFDRVIYPYLERRYHGPVSVSRRILLGMIFAMAAMIAAGVLEHFRLKAFYPNDTCLDDSLSQRIGDTTYYAAKMNVFWQIPQFLLIGISEVFTSVAGLQFAVSVAPKSMKGIIMGLFYLFSGVGSFFGTAIITILYSSGFWFYAPDNGNINCRKNCKLGDVKPEHSCHLDYYFYLLAAIELLGILLFALVAKLYHLDSLLRNTLASRPLLSREPSQNSNASHISGVRNRSTPHSIQQVLPVDVASS